MYQKKKKNKQAIITYDKDGDLQDFEDVQMVTRIEKRHFKKGEFYMQTFSLDHMILDRKYNITELRTLIILKSRLDFNNRIKGFRQSDLAKEVGTGQPNISNALKKLEQDRIIYKDGVDYYFSDEFIKGSGDNNKRPPKRKIGKLLTYAPKN